MANAVDSTGAELVDKNHWSYEGLKTVVPRMVKIAQHATTQATLQDRANVVLGLISGRDAASSGL